MPMRDRVKEKAPAFKGQKSGLPIESYGIDCGAEIKNFCLKEGQLKKSNGNSVYATVLDGQSGGVRSLHRFQYRWVAQRGSGLTLEDTEGGAVFTNKTTSLLSTNRLYSANWRDRIVFTNTQDAVQLLHASAASGATDTYGLFGLDAPSAISSSWFSGATSGNVEIGQYFYLITLYDENTNTESPASGALCGRDGLYELSPNGRMGPIPAEHNVSTSAKIVEIAYADLVSWLNTNTALYPRATHFIVYRSGSQAGGLYLTFNRVPIKNTTQDGQVFVKISQFITDGSAFHDNTATANLPSVSLLENNSPPPTPVRMLAAYNYALSNITGAETAARTTADYSGFRHIKFFRDQLFGIGARSPGITVREMAVGQTGEKVSGRVNNFADLLHGSEVYQPDYWPYVWEVGRGDGQQAIGLGVLGDVALLAFKEKSAYYLSGSSPDNYVLRIMDTNKGCVHQSTIQETPIGVITLDRGGFVLWNKIGQGERISVDIQDLVDQIDFRYADRFYSCYDPKDNRYRCAVSLPGAQNPNTTLVYDLESQQWTYESGAEGLCRASDTGSTHGFVDMVGSVTNGRLLDFSSEQSVTNQNNLIEGVWTSGTINFGDDQRKKKMQWIYLRAKSASSWRVNIEVIPDYDESRKFVIEDWDAISSQSLWYSSDVATDGTLIWDEGNWASDGPTRQVSKIPVKCIGYTFQIRIIHREVDPNRYGFAIESISAEGVIFGR